MTQFIVALICLVLALLLVMLRKAYLELPLPELKRQAIRGNKFAATIYPIVAYGPSFRGLLWLLLGIFSAIALVLFARLAPVGLGIVVVVTWLWLAFSWLPNKKTTAINRQLAERSTPLFFWFMHWTYPLTKELAKLSQQYSRRHTGMYEVDDLQAILLAQEQQPDNRMSKKQLERIKKILAFEHARVHQYARPWEEIKKLVANEPIGPLLLDELHRSHQSAFPVTKTKSTKQIIGILNQEDVGLKSTGCVSDHMRQPIRYISEDDTIEQALAKFSLSGQSMLVVINKVEQISGTLALSDALGSLLTVEKHEPKRATTANDRTSTEFEQVIGV